MTGDSCNEGERKHNVSLPFRARDLGQACPPSCPRQKPQEGLEEFGREDVDLGPPLSINEVSRLVGVSVWTVRHRCLAAGLPYFRVGPTGKLLFYKNQIIHWLLTEQRKGGIIP
jgi:hypothetical protein